MESRPGRGRRSRGTSTGADEAILARFAAIRVWTRGGERAPHKALLLLYALAALQRREPRLIPFARLEEAVGRLLRDFGPPRSTNPAYPFWHLQSDGVWEIPQREALQHDLDVAPWRHNPRVSAIREMRASERRFYLKITDIYEQCSIDYDPQAEITKTFFATVQNKLHWAVTGQTAAEIIASRAGAARPSMGLTPWKDGPRGARWACHATPATPRYRPRGSNE